MVELSVGSEVAGYRVEAVAGRGGMGVVYRAVDLALDRRVALKLISTDLADDAGFRDRFKRESRLAASIRHPNVITVFHAGEEGGRLYIAMEYIEGTDLKRLIAKRRRLPAPLAADLVAQVAAALDAAHARTLVHRDVKPANILIAGDQEPYHAYLTDFGLTKYTGSDSAITKTGMVVGTLDYMAPEQIEGGRLDARADTYSLGCVLFEALTGRVPYPRDSHVAKMFAHANEPPPAVTEVAKDVAPEFDGIVMTAMAKDPAQRFPSAGDLGRAAQAVAGSTRSAPTERRPAAAPPRPAPQRPARGRRRLRAAIATAVALAAAAVAAVVLLPGGDDAPSSPPRLSKEQYQDQVLDAARPFTKEAAKTERLPAHVKQARDALRAATQLATLRKTTDTYIRTLERMRPPADIESVHRQLIGIFRQIRGAIADGGAAADLGNDAVYRSIPPRLDKAFQALANLAPAFESRGYRRLGL